ncbi:hypothetical protein EV13_0702 [Prochlorococcus sp. MIT 0702]|nr:hypothetical protein EV12_0339 [Prochlorococcus sp. MIT 0701]KGG29898.1 hypothetical protein EV13_0702 [Prochlorococcus sp. MIT 0702]KGG34142.1 hypothetical protein EV14_1489 [Prochlorococcus sp. MIT 0703]
MNSIISGKKLTLVNIKSFGVKAITSNQKHIVNLLKEMLTA